MIVLAEYASTSVTVATEVESVHISSASCLLLLAIPTTTALEYYYYYYYYYLPACYCLPATASYPVQYHAMQ